MATVKTIKPAGGGDYTTLALWEDFADGQASADQHAECYTGGDMGEVSLSGWASTPSASVYPRIYAATGNAHIGTDASTGCYFVHSTSGAGLLISAGMSYTRVERIRIEDASAGGAAISVNQGIGNTINGIIIDSVLIQVTIAGGKNNNTTIINFGATNGNMGTTVPVIMRNCIIYGKLQSKSGRTNVAGYRAFAVRSVSGSHTMNIEWYNNIIHQLGNAAGSGDGFQIFSNIKAGTCTLNLTAKNNIGTNCQELAFDNDAGAGVTVNFTASHNCSSDATGDDWGATGSIINQTSASLYVSNTNVTPLSSTAPQVNVGATIAGFSTDAIGTTRPQGSAWDMGAIELLSATRIKDIISHGVIPRKR